MRMDWFDVVVVVVVVVVYVVLMLDCSLCPLLVCCIRLLDWLVLDSNPGRSTAASFINDATFHLLAMRLLEHARWGDSRRALV